MKRLILIGAIGVAILLLVAGSFAIWALGSTDFPTPTGPHRVGTLELSLMDSDRTEVMGAEPGGPREVGLRIWYPAAADAEGSLLPITDGRLNKAFSDFYGVPLGDEDGPPSVSIIDAPPLAGSKRLPVVLFSHGGFAHRDQNLSTMQELASQGFIAIAIGHTHEALLSLLPGGRAVKMDPRLAEGMAEFNSNSGDDDYLAALEAMRSAEDQESGITAARNCGRVMTKMFEPLGRTAENLLELRRGDIAFVLAQLSRLDADPEHPLHDRYDVERVGVFGHSLGGHAALSVCLDQSIQLRAGVILDTPYYLNDDRPVPNLERPVLFAYSDSTRLPNGHEFSLLGSNRFLRHSATVEPMSVVIDETTHMNFSDMNFMPRFLRLAGALGPIAGARAATVINDLVISFFRRHLMSEHQAWLDAPGERYPEVR